MSPEQAPAPDTLRFLLEMLCRGETLSEADRSFIEGILRAGNDSLTFRLQSLIGEALVRPLFAPRIHEGATPLASGAWRASEVVVVDGFLTTQEMGALLDFTLSQEGGFEDSKIVPPGSDGGGRSDYQRRQSKVLVDLREHYAVVTDRIKAVMPWVFQRFNWPPFRVSQVEAQLTASNDGEFFKAHNDNTAENLRSRELTFVYYFYREPKAFTGGELRLYDTCVESGHYVAEESCQTLSPQQNRIVFFPSCLVHEVLPIICPSHLFADSRFTVNGWLHNPQRRISLFGGPSTGPALSTPHGLPSEVP